MPRFDHHVFVCLNERDPADARGCCAQRGGSEVLGWFKDEVKRRGWKGRVRANKAGCLDACDFGPTVVVYPEGVWYSPRTRDDVARICEEHLAGGRPVEALCLPLDGAPD
jgi:(2Fe-2S) ferredoxin